MLYWTDWSLISPGIYRSSVITPARETLVSGSLTWLNALAIDFAGNQDYYTGILLVSMSLVTSLVKLNIAYF